VSRSHRLAASEIAIEARTRDELFERLEKQKAQRPFGPAPFAFRSVGRLSPPTSD
jgi:hypothetical protein